LLNLNELVDVKDSDVESLNRIIEELSAQRNITVDESAIKDETIIALNEVIDATLAELEDKVSQQLTNTTDAFDALSTQIEAQAKKSEEAAAKQLAAFEKAVGGIADALKPVEPEPDPENPAAETIKKILEKWDNITAITSNSYNIFDSILNDLDIKNKPAKTSYVFTPPSTGKVFRPSEEIKQHLKWNEELKPQIKSSVAGLTDETKAKRILTNVETLLKDSMGSLNNSALIDTLKDAITAWGNDFAKVRGTAALTIRKIALEIGIDPEQLIVRPDQAIIGARKFKDIPWENLGNDEYKNFTPILASLMVNKLPKDTLQLINLLKIFAEFQGGSW
jgi:hypothetical protein